jgi:hypothetical protein
MADTTEHLSCNFTRGYPGFSCNQCGASSGGIGIAGLMFNPPGRRAHGTPSGNEINPSIGKEVLHSLECSYGDTELLAFICVRHSIVESGDPVPNEVCAQK